MMVKLAQAQSRPQTRCFPKGDVVCFSMFDVSISKINKKSDHLNLGTSEIPTIFFCFSRHRSNREPKSMCFVEFRWPAETLTFFVVVLEVCCGSKMGSNKNQKTCFRDVSDIWIKQMGTAKSTRTSVKVLKPCQACSEV